MVWFLLTSGGCPTSSRSPSPGRKNKKSEVEKKPTHVSLDQMDHRRQQKTKKAVDIFHYFQNNGSITKCNYLYDFDFFLLR